MSTIATLISQLEAAQIELKLALTDGEDTAPIRTEITRIEAGITAARSAEAQAQREQAEQEAADVRSGTASLTESQHGAIEAATASPELAELIGEDLPAVERDHAIAKACHDVALATAAVNKASGAHQSLLAKAAKIRERLNAKQGEIAAIQHRRASGDQHPDDAGAVTLIQGDIGDLQRLLSDAQFKADSAEPNAARQALCTAQATLDHLRSQAVLRAAEQRMQLAEKVFIQSHQALVTAALAAGNRNAQASAYKASSAVRQITYGV
ncbi:hypothetical protein [Pseudomonas brassicacearum]|uniref:Uncharacterized protein n=1 Tax=Pseudomonas brassicacearum TaxID=930166 RepID=A0A423H1W7_9PSED|nr:hypothetical protein [Pseudomonas brassicacearum]RON06226.1 hypothetical protein BK658_00095 [Pseudomonas brassicacearum]